MTESIRRHPLVTFFLLVFIITWVVWVPRASGAPLGAAGQAWTWAPAIAALLAATLTGGRGALRELGARLEGVCATAAAHPLQRPRCQLDPWCDLGAVAVPPALDGGKRHVSPARLVTPLGRNGEGGSLHLGFPAHPRKRSNRHAVSRGDQPVHRLAGR